MSIKHRKLRAMLVLTFLLNGGLNQMILRRCLFLRAFCGADRKPWIKKDSNSLFDVTMGSYDGAEICELVA